MGNLRFPSRLKPIVSKGYSQTRGSNIYRNEVQGGLPRQGRDTYFEAVPISVTLVVSSLGRQAFLSFLNNIHGGADSFIMPHDTGYGVQDHQVMITSNIGDSTDDGINWIITFTATAERTAIQEDNCLTQNLPDLFGCYGESIHGFLNAYGVSQTTFPRIWSSEGPAGYPPINMQQLTLDGRIAYSGPSVNYLNSSGLLVPSSVNEWPLQFVGGVAVGRVAPEDESSNIYIQSESWSNGLQTVVTNNALASPRGDTSMALALDTTVTAEHYVNDRNVTLTAGVTYCFSVFVKSYISPRNLYMRVASGTTAGSFFDASTGTFAGGSVGANFVSRGFTAISNGIYRVWMTFTAGATQTSVIRIQMANNVTASFAGSGSNGFYIWGGQIEISNRESSYIPTTTTISNRASASASVFMNGATSINITYSDASVVNVLAVGDYAQIPQANSAWGSKFITRIDFVV